MAKVTIGSVPGKMFGYIKESRDELRKVTWPSRQTTVRYTLIVIGASLVVGFLIGGIDFGFTKALETFLF